MDKLLKAIYFQIAVILKSNHKNKFRMFAALRNFRKAREKDLEIINEFKNNGRP